MTNAQCGGNFFSLHSSSNSVKDFMDMFLGGCYQEQEQLYIHVLFWKIKETGSIGIKKSL